MSFVNFPTKLRPGHRAVFDVREDTFDVDRDIHVSVQASDPARPISFPYEADRLSSPAVPVDEEVDDGEETGRFSMEFRAGDGDARVVATWPNTYSYTDFSGSRSERRTGECEQSASKGIVLVPGEAPAVRLRVRRYEESLQGGDTDNLEFDFSKGGFDLGCRESLPGRLTLKVSGLGRTLAFTAKHSCLEWEKGRRTANGWKLSEEDYNVLFRPRMGSGRTTFRFKTVWGSKVLSQGNFRVTVTRRRTRRIYEGTDAFFNVCISENRTIKSRNLRLYCTQPGSVNRRISLAP